MGQKIKGVPNDEVVIDIHNEADVAYSEMWLRAHGFSENVQNKL